MTYFWTQELRKTWLDKCLKSVDSENPSTSNMVNALEHIWNLFDSDFTIFIDHCEGNSIKLEKVSLSNMQNVRTAC